MEERRKKRVGDVKFVLYVLLFSGLVVFLFPKTRVLAFYDRMFMTKFTSAEGNFSMEIPRRWDREKSGARRSGNVYLDARGAVWGGGYKTGARRILQRATVTVVMEALAPDRPTPSPQELGDELSVRLGVIRGLQAQTEELLNSMIPAGPAGLGLTETPSKTVFEVKRLKGYQWAKTTLTFEDRTRIVWQVVDDRSNHYTITFATDNISRYGPVFDKMIQSFSFSGR